jgi:hypothetical protein
VNQQMKASFDTETHGTFPKVLAAMAMVASVNREFYSDLRQLQKRVFDLWEQVATALHQEPDPNEPGPDIAMQTLAACWPRAEKLDDELPKNSSGRSRGPGRRATLMQMLTYHRPLGCQERELRFGLQFTTLRLGSPEYAYTV